MRVAIITSQPHVTVQKLSPSFASFQKATRYGEFRDGSEFRIFRVERRADLEVLRGLEPEEVFADDLDRMQFTVDELVEWIVVNWRSPNLVQEIGPEGPVRAGKWNSDDCDECGARAWSEPYAVPVPNELTEENTAVFFEPPRKWMRRCEYCGQEQEINVGL